MPIVAVTGLPGHGKTLWTLQRYREIAEKDGRPVYYAGITGLKLPWTEYAPEKWGDLPPGAILIIDEAWRVFPMRGRGEPPAWIGELAVHRHKGIDIVLVTQDIRLVDVFVRRLVDRHFHVVRKFGTQFATVHEFPTGVRENAASTRGGSIRHEWRYPRDVFDLYESAELHTVKRRLPAKVYILGLAVVLGGIGVAASVYRLSPERIREAAAAKNAAAAASAPAGAVQPGGRPTGRPDGVGFVESHVPRVPGLAYTAPVYDAVTKPVEAPYPAACLAVAARCQCYTQQGTKLDVPADLCRSIADGGFFVAWDRPAARAVPTRDNGTAGGQGGGAVSLGGQQPAVFQGARSSRAAPSTSRPNVPARR